MAIKDEVFKSFFEAYLCLLILFNITLFGPHISYIFLSFLKTGVPWMGFGDLALFHLN